MNQLPYYPVTGEEIGQLSTIGGPPVVRRGVVVTLLLVTAIHLALEQAHLRRRKTTHHAIAMQIK